MDQAELRDRLLETIRFNSARTLSGAEPSRFRVETDGALRWSVDPARPDPYYNRVLGFDRTAVPQLDGLLASYATEGLTPQFDLEPDALCPEVGSALSARGFVPTLNLPFLQRTPERFASSEIRIERWEHDRADDFLALLGTSGASCEPSVWEVQRRYYCTDTFRTFVAYLDGQPCGWANLLVDGEYGYLANAFTHESARRRGAHTALLHTRLTDAAGLGLSTTWTDVEWHSASHRNCDRAGFELLTMHSHWTK